MNLRGMRGEKMLSCPEGYRKKWIREEKRGMRGKKMTSCPGEMDKRGKTGHEREKRAVMPRRNG